MDEFDGYPRTSIGGPRHSMEGAMPTYISQLLCPETTDTWTDRSR